MPYGELRDIQPPVTNSHPGGPTPVATRRKFLKTAGIAGAGTLLFCGRAFPFDQSPIGVRKFSVSLPGLGPGGKNELGNYIPVLTPNTTLFPGVDFYHVVAKQF